MANPDNIKKHEFKKGQSGNPSGRPKGSFSAINEELRNKGVQPLRKKELIEAYTLIFNSDEDELKRIAKDKHTPYGLKLIILELNNAKTRSKALSDYRDYMFGKAKESIDHTTKGESINIVNLGSGVKPK